MTMPAAESDSAKICHGTPISLRLPQKYDELTRDIARREGRPLTNFVRWGFTQFNYEKDVASPSVEYLYKLEKLGVDIGFLVTGQRTMPASMKHDELDQRTAGLVRRWAQLGEPAKNLVETTVQLLPVVESTNIKPTA